MQGFFAHIHFFQPLQEGCSLLWGYLYYLKRQAYLFSEGKLTYGVFLRLLILFSAEALRTKSQNCIRKQKKTASHIRSRAYHMLTTDSTDHIRQLQLQRSLRKLNATAIPGQAKLQRKVTAKDSDARPDSSDFQSLIHIRKKVFTLASARYLIFCRLSIKRSLSSN